MTIGSLLSFFIGSLDVSYWRIILLVPLVFDVPMFIAFIFLFWMESPIFLLANPEIDEEDLYTNFWKMYTWRSSWSMAKELIEAKLAPHIEPVVTLWMLF